MKAALERPRPRDIEQNVPEKLTSVAALWLNRLTTISQSIKFHRNKFLALFLLLFAVGLIWSANRLTLSWNDIQIRPAILLFFVMGPLGVAYGALGLMQLAWVDGRHIAFRDAWQIAGYAQLAEALPLPGGAIVRVLALRNVGAPVGKSVVLVTGAAILWVAIASIGSSVVVFNSNIPLGVGILFLGTTVTIIISVLIARVSRTGVATAILAHRAVGLLLMSIRMFLAFSIIGEDLTIKSSLYFAFANVAGSASAIAPAGLGVGEAIAAAMAKLAFISPAAAFLAVALNRIISVASCGTLVALSTLFLGSRRRSHVDEGRTTI